MSFFIVEFKIYRTGKSERRRLFRPNIPAIKSTERWIHCKVFHRNPEAIVRARPDKIIAGDLIIPTYGGEWIFNGELSVWIFQVRPHSENKVKDLSFSFWTYGRYEGEIEQLYR